MNLIAAADENWGIGKNGGLLAHISGDMKYFGDYERKSSSYGAKNTGKLSRGKPLKNRVNIVLTQNQDFAPEGVTVCHSIEETLETLKQYPKEDVFIIGGGMIYKAFLPWCEKLILPMFIIHLRQIPICRIWRHRRTGKWHLPVNALPMDRKVISRLWTMDSGSMKGSVNEISCNSR
ncbi:MAG: dihydrofolate reductase [Enterocloster sp.]